MSTPQSETMMHALPRPGCPYRVTDLSISARSQPLSSQVLCALRFGGDSDSVDDDPRRILLPLLPLDEVSAVGELWLSAEPVQSGWVHDLGYAENGQIMMVQLQVPEAQLVRMENAVREVYRRLIRFISGAGYPHLLRVWNYLDRINQGEGDAERYQRFCAGRYRAMADTDGFEHQLPAASAIGSRDGSGLRLFALAARQPGLQVENPRQVSAFNYPRIYGARSPSFSRATWVPWADGVQLLVSGTASIVGHATVHAGDPQAQLRQAVANIETVRAHAVRSHLPGVDPVLLQLESCILYVRRESDWLGLQAMLPELFGSLPVRVLAGDICRRELLVEVEAMYRQTSELVC